MKPANALHGKRISSEPSGPAASRHRDVPCAVQRGARAPLQDAGPARGARRRLTLAASLAACILASPPVLADDPPPLETPRAPARAAWWRRPRPAAIPASLGAAGERPGSLLPKLARPPLDPPLTINGGFGEYRAGHFHAGLDFGTGERVGRPVYAPLAGRIGRVRTSGVGYGRSLYLQAEDGRLLQFGHLDAFAEPVASYVAAVQESSGQYEQDLWPDPGRFQVTEGDVIAWTGESGAGGPHLHFEVRRGDVAFNPFRAGISVRDESPPVLASLTLEPLDDASFVERGASPYTLAFGALSETLLVEGRVRAVVGARDGVGQGARRIVPWSVAMEFDGRIVECRFDSLSWATDMPEGDYVFDAGRIVGEKGFVLWAPAGFRPRVILADAPPEREAGTIVVRPGDAPRRMKIVARDAAGGRTVRTVVLRAPGAAERGPDPARAGGRAKPVAADERFEFAALPGGFWRVVYRGAPPGSRDVTLQVGLMTGRRFACSTRGADWTVVVDLSDEPEWRVAGQDAAGQAWLEEGPALGPLMSGEPDFYWALSSRDALFEPSRIEANYRPAREEAPPELALIATVGRLEPEALPLRRPVHIRQSLSGVRDTARVGLYRHDRDGWSYLGAKRAADASGIEADSRRLGTFALFADTLAPRVAPLAPARAAAQGRYSRWALEVLITEEGSGVDARASGFEVDGARVPSEWDAEERTLRWRPRSAPAAGTHRFTITAADRAGNVVLRHGTFVID